MKRILNGKQSFPKSATIDGSWSSAHVVGFWGVLLQRGLATEL